MTNTDKQSDYTLAGGTHYTADGIGALLDRGLICAAMRGGKWYRARRNGATKIWKTRQGHFRIPVKAGFRACGAITHNNLSSFACVDDLDALGIKHT